MSTLARVASVLHDVFGIPPESVRPTTELASQLQLDSLSIVELQLALEDTFGVALDDSGAAEVDTVQDLVELVEQALRAQEEAS